MGLQVNHFETLSFLAVLIIAKVGIVQLPAKLLATSDT